MLNEKMMEIVKLGVDQVNRVPVANFSQADRDMVIREKLAELTETNGKFDIMSYNKHKYEIFEIIREVIAQTIANGDGALNAFLAKFVEEERIELGDIKEYEVETDGYLTVAKVSGDNLDIARQRLDKGVPVAVRTEAFAVKVFEYYKRFATGRIRFEDLVAKIDLAFRRKKQDLILTALVGAVSGLPANYAYSGNLDMGEIENVLAHVSACNYGTEVVIVGTRPALNKIQAEDVPMLADSHKEEMNEIGHLRRWKGYDCVELPMVLQPNSIDEFVFDEKTLYVLPANAKCIKFIEEGMPIVVETGEMENKDMAKEVSVIRRYGCAVIHNRLIGHIEITE